MHRSVRWDQPLCCQCVAAVFKMYYIIIERHRILALRYVIGFKNTVRCLYMRSDKLGKEQVLNKP